MYQTKRLQQLKPANNMETQYASIVGRSYCYFFLEIMKYFLINAFLI